MYNANIKAYLFRLLLVFCALHGCIKHYISYDYVTNNLLVVPNRVEHKETMVKIIVKWLFNKLYSYKSV